MDMTHTHYWHALEGRLRIKVPAVKRSPEHASRIERLIGALDGVTQVNANPTTGNVFVLFCPRTRTHADIVSVLHEAQYLHTASMPQTSSSSLTNEVLIQTLGQAIARSVTEALLHRAFLALL
jgi:copper chaperone CopZ